MVSFLIFVYHLAFFHVELAEASTLYYNLAIVFGAWLDCYLPFSIYRFYLRDASELCLGVSYYFIAQNVEPTSLVLGVGLAFQVQD